MWRAKPVKENSRRRDAEQRMPLIGHLRELRRRAGRAAIAIVAGVGIGWFLVDIVWVGLAAPVGGISGKELATLNFTSVAGGFDLRMQIAILLGIVIASPVWLWQLFAFLVPAMRRREKQLVLGFMLSAVPLFLGGCVAGWMLLPHVVHVMTSFVPSNSATILEARGYLDFSIKLILATGVSFVFPVFIVLLNFAGVLSAESIRHGWRWALLAITLFTAIATPASDLLSMFLLALPMLALYVTAILITSLRERRRAVGAKNLLRFRRSRESSPIE